MANGFGSQFAKGFEKTFQPSFLQAQQTTAKSLEARREQKLELEQASKLGQVVKELNLPGADKIGQALEDGSITASQAISLSGAIQKGTPSALEAALLGELGIDLGGIGLQAGGGVTAPKVQPTGEAEAPPTDRAVQPVTRGGLELETLRVGGATLKPIETEEEKEAALQSKLQEIQATGELETSKQVRTQKEKDILKAEQDFTNATLKIDNTFDSFLDVVERTREITGVEPGVISGSITSILGRTRANEFFQGFKGGLTEYAAAIGRIAIPGARATRLVNLFKGTAPTTFDTIASGIQTSADSFRNGLATDMSRNPEAYIKGFTKLNKTEQREATAKLTVMLQGFEDTFKEGLLRRAFNKNPLLVPEKDRAKFEAEQRGDLGGRTDEELDAEIAELEARQ